MSDGRPMNAPKRIALLLLPEFSMLPVTSVIETLRLANHISGQPLYHWTVHSMDAEPVTASNGIRIAVQGDRTKIPDSATVLICGGYNAELYAGERLVQWLKASAVASRVIGGVCTGVTVLAAAGLLNGRRCTLHWEIMPAFRKAYPHLTVTGHFYEVDGDRMTCAGGTAAVDMTLAIISTTHGEALATAIAENIIHPPIRARDERQPRSVTASLGTRHPKVLAIIGQMERTLDQPLKPSVLAKRAGLSVRQLERLFQRYLNCSPKHYHQRLRLQRARLMLIRTELSVTEVSAACGFSNPSYFSRCYSSVYDRPPKDERGIPKLQAA